MKTGSTRSCARSTWPGSKLAQDEDHEGRGLCHREYSESSGVLPSPLLAERSEGAFLLFVGRVGTGLSAKEASFLLAGLSKISGYRILLFPRHHGRSEQHQAGQGGEESVHDRYSDRKWAAELVGGPHQA